MDEDYKEVYFHDYCDTCKHRDLEPYKEPCNECLETFTNLSSHKPINWEAKDK